METQEHRPVALHLSPMSGGHGKREEGFILPGPGGLPRGFRPPAKDLPGECDWPKVESYALIDQIRHCSRSVGANVAEAWAKRRYPAHFLSKLTDADGELRETLHWLAAAGECGYPDAGAYAQVTREASRLGQRLGMMIDRSESFCF